MSVEEADADPSIRNSEVCPWWLLMVLVYAFQVQVIGPGELATLCRIMMAVEAIILLKPPPHLCQYTV